MYCYGRRLLLPETVSSSCRDKVRFIFLRVPTSPGPTTYRCFVVTEKLNGSPNNIASYFMRILFTLSLWRKGASISSYPCLRNHRFRGHAWKIRHCGLLKPSLVDVSYTTMTRPFIGLACIYVYGSGGSALAASVEPSTTRQGAVVVAHLVHHTSRISDSEYVHR